MDCNLTQQGITVLIPAYYMQGRGSLYLKQCLQTIRKQIVNFPVEILVGLNGPLIDELIDICKLYSARFVISKNTTTTSVLNDIIPLASFDIIKFLFQDDFFCQKTSLQNIFNQLAPLKKGWLATGCCHCYENADSFFNFHLPAFHNQIHLGVNTIGSPSVIAVKDITKQFPLYDERLTMLLDVDYYQHLYKKYGQPLLIFDFHVCNRLHSNQLTHKCKNEEIEMEIQLMKEKW